MAPHAVSECAAQLDALIGERLRGARRRRRLTLAEVERISGGEFRTSVLGAYERGERSVRVHRLLRLAQIYGVQAATLLPSGCDHAHSGGIARFGFPSDAVL